MKRNLIGMFFLLSLLGCGGERPYPVVGQIVLPDGRPLTGGQIEFRGADRPISAIGAIDADGRFALNFREQGDGALAGRYKAVLISPPHPSGIPGQEAADAAQRAAREAWLALVPPRYQSIEATPLEFEVSSDPWQNDFQISLQP